MAQFDCHELRDGRLIVIAQSDLLDTQNTLFVIPLVPPDDDAKKSDRLNPELVVGGETYVLATHLAGTIASRELGPRQASLGRHDYVIKGALDVLIYGF